MIVSFVVRGSELVWCSSLDVVCIFVYVRLPEANSLLLGKSVKSFGFQVALNSF